MKEAFQVGLQELNESELIPELFNHSFVRSCNLSIVRFIYTPKHASWLKMAEIEINLLDHKCLDRNIPKIIDIEREIGAWCKQSNTDKRKLFWSFTKYKADKILSKYYVS